MTESSVYKCDICGKNFSTSESINAKVNCHYHEEACVLNKIKSLLTTFKPSLELYWGTWEDEDGYIHCNIFLDYNDAKEFMQRYQMLGDDYKVTLDSTYLRIS